METPKILKKLARIFFQALFISLILDFLLKFTSLPKNNIVLTVFVVFFIFGIWFHFVSESRFKHRRPKGLYNEYIKWFLEESKY